MAGAFQREGQGGRRGSGRRLIVNADDLGADRERNQGILEGVAAGAVTAVSLLANGSAFLDAVERIHGLAGRRPAVGLHLNLSEGAPLAPGHGRLVGPDGCFLGKAEARRLLLAAPDPALAAEIGREARAQLARLRAAGLEVLHLDGHQHVHVFPAVREAALGLARAEGIPWIRIPEEPEPGLPLPGVLRADAALFRRRGRETRPLAAAAGLAAPAHFRGLYLKPWLAEPTLGQILEALPEGLTELMVHPGRAPRLPGASPFGRFSTRDREVELERLLDPAFPAALAAGGIELVAFARPALPAGRADRSVLT